MQDEDERRESIPFCRLRQSKPYRRFSFDFSGSPAIGADADNAQQMLRDFEPVLCGHRVLYRFQFSGIELDDLATFRTDHVVVVLVLVVVLVMRAAITKANFARQARLSQKFERAIDRRVTNGWVFLLHQAIEILAREVLFGAQKDIQDQVTLGRSF